MLLQNLPTQSWSDDEIGELVAEAYQLHYMFSSAPNHLLGSVGKPWLIHMPEPVPLLSCFKPRLWERERTKLWRDAYTTSHFFYFIWKLFSPLHLFQSDGGTLRLSIGAVMYHWHCTTAYTIGHPCLHHPSGPIFKARLGGKSATILYWVILFIGVPSFLLPLPTRRSFCWLFDFQFCYM